MFEKIYRFFTGRISFTAYEGFQEMFLNACKNEKLTLTDAVITDTQITACVRYVDYGKLLRAAECSGMMLGEVREYGFPALIKKYKKRIGIPVGLLLASVILITLSSMLWSIDVEGLKTINPQDFSSFLEKNGVKTGCFTENIDCNEIEAVIRRYGENILDATVNLVGCKMFIHVQERETDNAIKNENQYCNIVASKDGEILKAYVFAGESLIKPGDAAVKGDVLVRGQTVTPGGEYYCVEAKAQIFARTAFCVTCQTAEQINISRIVKLKNKYSFALFGLTLPRKPERISSANRFSTDTGVFPVGVIRAAEAETEKETMELTPQESFLISVTDLALAAEQRLCGVKIIECMLRIENDAQICIDAQFYCEEDIAKKEYFNLPDES